MSGIGGPGLGHNPRSFCWEVGLIRSIGGGNDDGVGFEAVNVAGNIAAVGVSPTLANVIGELAASGEKHGKQTDEKLLDMVHGRHSESPNETQDQLPRALCACHAAYAPDGRHSKRKSQ